MKMETNRDIDLTLDWNSAFAAPQKQEEHSGSISDALVRCLTTRGNVDIEYIYAVRQAGENSFIFLVDADPEDPAEQAERQRRGEKARRLQQKRGGCPGGEICGRRHSGGHADKRPGHYAGIL